MRALGFRISGFRVMGMGDTRILSQSIMVMIHNNLETLHPKPYILLCRYFGPSRIRAAERIFWVTLRVAREV